MENTKDRMAYLRLLEELLKLEKEKMELVNSFEILSKYYPKVEKIFDKAFIYNKGKYPFYKPIESYDDYFYQKIRSLLPSKNPNLHATLDIKSLNQYNNDLAYYNKQYISNYNYYLFLIMFANEFNREAFTSYINTISRNGNVLSGCNNNILFTMEKNKELDLTTTEIIIPNEVKISYDASSYQLNKEYKKVL